MSERYPGGVISQTPVTPTPTSAPGIWTLDQQLQAQKAGTWPFGGPFVYIEDVFSTYLYTGTGATLTITNGIDLSTKGGMVWIKSRSAATNNCLFDTSRGATKYLNSNTTGASTTDANGLTAFNTTGFTLGTGGTANDEVNVSSALYGSWTFRKQPKFFDVVTYTGNGSNRTISHSLGSVPGCIIIKRTDTTSAWAVYHRSIANTEYLVLNTTAAKATGATYWNSTTATSTDFSLGTAADVNANTGTYVAYLFANDAGGFGMTGTDNVISCSSFTTDASGLATVTSLGYEPQWLLFKNTNSSENWLIFDNMRGLTNFDLMAPSSYRLNPNTSNVEGIGYATPTANGFSVRGGLPALNTYIYVAIRRGPMKIPTTGTKVLSSVAYSGTGAAQNITGTNAPVDLSLIKGRGVTGRPVNWNDRLRGRYLLLASNQDTNESIATNGLTGFDLQNGVSLGSDASSWGYNLSSDTYIAWLFSRAPSVVDVVCYTGTGADTPQSHNLTVAPEMIITKSRSDFANWRVSAYPSLTLTQVANLNSANPFGANSTEFYRAPTATQFSPRDSGNTAASTYVSYLFASCSGVSKVGTYNGTGATLTVSCGFAARFVMIKRTDSTGNWFVWDTTRGMVAGTDPRLSLNTTDGDTNNNWVYTDASGFQVVTTNATVNASGGSYIYLAIS